MNMLSGVSNSVRYVAVFTRARGHHRQQRDRPIRGYSRSALARSRGRPEICYVLTTLSEASSTREEERRTRLLLALAGLGKLVQSSVTAAPKGTQRRRSAAVSLRDAPHWSVISRRASSMTGVYRMGRKSQFGSRSLLGAYVAFAFGSQ